MEDTKEEPVLYVPTGPSAPTDSSLPPTAAVRRAVQGLRVEAERRAWAVRDPLRPVGEAASDPLAGLLAQLRAATTRYVGVLRAEGARPEQMLVRVKAFVREAMDAEGWRDPDATQALTAEVVRWSIDAYYDR